MLEESIAVFFSCGCFLLSWVLITGGFLRNINTRLFPGQKIKWLICVLTVRYQHTGMHAGQLRHVCSCSLKAACQVREIWETRSHQSGPDLSNETFLLRRSVTDMNHELCSVSLPYLVGLVIVKYKMYAEGDSDLQ